MNRPIIQRILEDALDSDCEGPPAVPAHMAPLAETAIPPVQAVPLAMPTLRPMCWSNQHPSLRVGIARGVAGVGGGAASSSGGMGVGSGSVGSAISAPAEDVVIDDSSAEDEPIAIAPSSSPDSIMWSWIQRIGVRMIEADEFVRANGNRVRWHLSPPGQNIVDFAIAYVNDVLDQGYVKAFYIGLTAKLPQRWSGQSRSIAGSRPMRGHNVKWQRMVIVGASDDADEIGNAEISVIAKFRRHDLRGQLINPNGHHLCHNQNPGGEGAHAGVPPHLLYVCFNWNPRA